MHLIVKVIWEGSWSSCSFDALNMLTCPEANLRTQFYLSAYLNAAPVKELGILPFVAENTLWFKIFLRVFGSCSQLLQQPLWGAFHSWCLMFISLNARFLSLILTSGGPPIICPPPPMYIAFSFPLLFVFLYSFLLSYLKTMTLEWLVALKSRKDWSVKDKLRPVKNFKRPAKQ